VHHLLPTDITKALDDLSEPRLSSYRNFFLPTTDQELYGLYCWNDAISTRFMRLIGVIEIIMRNRFHRELSQFAFTTGVSLGTPVSNDWYRIVVANTKNATASNLKKKTGNKSLISLTPAHQVIAGMTYGFWPHLLKISHTPAGVQVPWKTMIPSMFPNHEGNRKPKWWDKEHNQDKLFARLGMVNDFRNRIAHFEPLWKFHDLKDEWTNSATYAVNVVSPTPANSAEAIARLRLTYERTTQLLHWLSKERAADYMLSESHFCLDWLFSSEGLDHYKKIGSEETLRLGSLTKSWGAKLELRNRKSVLIVNNKVAVGRYYSLWQPKQV
jgi:hypothetical protein